MMTKRTFVFDSTHRSSAQVDIALRLPQLPRVQSTVDVGDDSESPSTRRPPAHHPGLFRNWEREESTQQEGEGRFSQGGPLHRCSQCHRPLRLAPSSPPRIPLAPGLATSVFLLLLAYLRIITLSLSPRSSTPPALPSLENGTVLPPFLYPPPNWGDTHPVSVPSPSSLPPSS